MGEDEMLGNPNLAPPLARKPLAWREIATFIITMSMVVGFFALMFGGQVPMEDKHIAVGALIGWVGASISYYSGSSQGSTVKGEAQNQTIQKLSEKGP